jgi:nicotinamide mononucleotide (NMN) deamidase PncC
VTTPEKILDQLRSQSQYLVVAESLTGGLLTARFAAIAGASDVLLTGIVAYDTRLKHELLGFRTSFWKTKDRLIRRSPPKWPMA